MRKLSFIFVLSQQSDSELQVCKLRNSFNFIILKASLNIFYETQYSIVYTWAEDAWMGSEKTIHFTHSEHGGVVSEPRYAQYLSKFSVIKFNS